MAFCLCHVKVFVRDGPFFTDFVFVCSEENDTRKNLPSNGNTMVQVATLYYSVHTLQPFL